MMDDQLAQTQTIEALRRQVETSNNAARDAQALLRATQDQQQYFRMPPPSNLPTTTGGIISNTPFVPPFSTPSTGLRTRELHGPGYYHVGSPADPGYAEQMRAMYGTSGREDIDHPHRGLVPSPVKGQYGKVDQARVVGSFLLVGLIPGRLLTDGQSNSVRKRSRSSLRRLW